MDPDQNPNQPITPLQPHPTNPVVQSTDYPGKTLGIIGLILAFVAPLIGLVVSVIANKQSKTANHQNAPAKAGVILGILFTVISAIILGIFVFVMHTLFSKCQELGNGTHVVDGVTYTCNNG